MFVIWTTGAIRGIEDIRGAGNEDPSHVLKD